MGVWIETNPTRQLYVNLSVTPCMGVWIETQNGAIRLFSNTSHTLYGCVD